MNEDRLVNPFLRKDIMLQQTLQWRIIDSKKIYKLELILPFTSKPERYKSGGYVAFIAENEESESIILHLPYISFCNALSFLPINLKRRITKDTEVNIYMEFTKMTDKLMIIKEIYQKAPKPEHYEIAKQFYSVNNQEFNEE